MVRGRGPGRLLLPSFAYFFSGEALRPAQKRLKNGPGPTGRPEPDLLRHASVSETALPWVPGAPAPQAGRPGSLPKADGQWRPAAAEKATVRQPFRHIWVVAQNF